MILSLIIPENQEDFAISQDRLHPKQKEGKNSGLTEALKV
jgi:hypothetical protein